MTYFRTKLLMASAFLLVALSALSLAPQSVDAKDILQDVCPAGSTSETCQSKTTANPLTGTGGLLYKVATVVSIVAGIAAVIMIVLGGMRYITSGGDTQKITSAKHTIVGALIGLVIIVLAQTIITFVIKRL